MPKSSSGFHPMEHNPESPSWPGPGCLFTFASFHSALHSRILVTLAPTSGPLHLLFSVQDCSLMATSPCDSHSHVAQIGTTHLKHGPPSSIVFIFVFLHMLFSA